MLEAIWERSEKLTGLIDDLDAARRELLEADRELTATGTELRQQNEELLVAQEEAEAAAEEIETLNEEQQATNEELETLNEELQATVEELNTTNDDLEARQRELHELAASLEAERARLAAILADMADAVLVVDQAGGPILTNPAFDRLFGTVDFAPEDDDGRPLPADALPQRRAARGEAFRMRFSAATSDGCRRRFEVSARPSRSDEPQGILVIREVGQGSPPPPGG